MSFIVKRSLLADMDVPRVACVGSLDVCMCEDVRM